MQKIDYNDAYAEVLEVLNYIPMEEYKKIPKSFITFMEENCNEKNEFVYNIALPFEKQNLSENAMDILAMIYRLFLATDQKKKELDRVDKLIMQNEEMQKREKYNPDDLFRNKQSTENDILTSSANIIVYKKSLFDRIREKIKNLFSGNNNKK